MSTRIRQEHMKKLQLRVCARHFNPDEIDGEGMLQDNAVPTYLWRKVRFKTISIFRAAQHRRKKTHMAYLSSNFFQASNFWQVPLYSEAKITISLIVLQCLLCKAAIHNKEGAGLEMPIYYKVNWLLFMSTFLLPFCGEIECRAGLSIRHPLIFRLPLPPADFCALL